MVNVFALPVFFIVFRETLETTIIISVLLAFLKQTLGPEKDPVIHKKLVRQVWLGVIIGLAICVAVGAGMIGAFYGLGRNTWEQTEYIWEGVFALMAVVIISLMGAAMLRVSKMQDKWRVKLARAIEAKDKTNVSTGGRFKRWCEKYAMFILPFVTVLREGVEAVVFIAGVSLGLPAAAFPLPVLCGLAAGCIIGYFIYKGGKSTPLQIFLIISTCVLYLVAAGLMSRAVAFFETGAWNKAVGGDAAETGAGAGSYDIRQSVWHVNCCSPDLDGGGGWGVFNKILGWTNSATYGTVISYNVYWICVILSFLAMRYNEKTGHWPLMKPKARAPVSDNSSETPGEVVVVTEKASTGRPTEEDGNSPITRPGAAHV